MDVKRWATIVFPSAQRSRGCRVFPLAPIAAVVLAIQPFSLYGKPVTEKTERIDIDWGSLKIRFAGHSAEPVATGEGYGDNEKRAWTAGLLAARDDVAQYHKDHLAALGVEQTAADLSAKEAGDRVASTTYAINTEYFDQGGVKVYLENSLARALQRNDLLFKQQKAGDLEASRFSGLVLRGDKAVKPQAAYRVVDETGQLLFDVAAVAKDAYEKNLMGRWFEEPSRSELTHAVGSKPVSLTFQWDSKGQMVVQGFAWREALQDSQAVLQNARIAIVVPKT